MEKEKEEAGAEDQASGGAAVTGGCVNGVSAGSAGTNPTDWDTGYDSDERKEASSNNKLARPSLDHRQLNYIEVEMERGSDSSNPQTPKTPTTPLPQTPTRRTELYSVIDIERTAAMSSLQKALPRDDETVGRDLRSAAALYNRGNMASLSLAPVNIFRPGADEEKAETARLSSFIGAIAIGDLVKSTLGPKGMDKILLSSGREGSVTVTNDGATILKAIGIDNPAAKVLVDMSKVQDDEVGDGTTSVTVLAAELLREAELLIAKKIHPQIIISGWRKATQAARDALRSAAVDHGNDEVKFREDLMNIARTTLSSKLLTHHKEHFSNLAVQAVLRLKGSGNLEAIHVIKKLGGSLTDSYLDEGFLLDKKIGVNQPKRIENAKILIANTGMDTDKIKIFGSRVRVDSTAKIAEIEQAEKEKMKEKVERILKHGINCFINRQLIYNYPEQLFGAAGVMAIEHADFAGVERLALVTGGEIASTFDHPEMVKLGHCKLIEEVMIGEDKLIHFSGVDMGEACTIVLRGATQQILDESERSLHDALCVLSQTVKETRTVFGGGCSEMLMAKVVTDLAIRTPGKEAVAMESFAKALAMLPTIIADNAGYDSADLVAQLRAAHVEGKTTYGLDMVNGTIGDMVELGVTESFQVKRQVLLSAAEAAEMILRVDNIIKAAPRKRVPDHHPC
ncbi:T-complex protein 1 subunit beta [Acipenser oxyrinchus oxyrinchus]|uniref:T-complex protein 1 subunit beta n=3 Tax=Acipenseroidei TaxID=186622 RepID=A0AAD8G7C0_ACIOX|nr:T-complex protein 1 subunit beta [Acipenser oxyrinchus oxyrinchus]